MKIAHSFLVCVKSVSLYHFKLAYIVLHMAVKEFSKILSKNREIGRFNLQNHFRSTLKISCSVLLNVCFISVPSFI